MPANDEPFTLSAEGHGLAEAPGSVALVETTQGDRNGNGAGGGVCRAYFSEHPEARYGVMKAYYAFHSGHHRTNTDGHFFGNGARYSKCKWCDRDREAVRYDDLPGACQSRPEIPEIAAAILGEEQKAFALLAKAERIVPKIVEKIGMSGETLAVLHHTHGYDPETVSGVVDVPPAMLAEYHDAMMREQARSRAAIKREVITVSLGGGGGVLVGKKPTTTKEQLNDQNQARAESPRHNPKDP